MTGQRAGREPGGVGHLRAARMARPEPHRREVIGGARDARHDPRPASIFIISHLQ